MEGKGESVAGTKRILVAMSGGVDSSTAAWLLKEAGHEVAGVFMSRRKTTGEAAEVPEAEGARRVAVFLDVPFSVVDVSDAFEVLIDYFCSEYLCGRTPNPCVMCNEQIKFARLLAAADRLGMERLATGHYVRLEHRRGRWCLRRGIDTGKDQSYYLCALSQQHLARAVFPLGERTKDEVRSLAREIGLPAARTEESQDVCFVPDGRYAALVRERAGERVKPGDIVDTSGNVVGRHRGIVDFTIGQRRGVGVAVGKPVYVVDIEPQANRVVVGRRGELEVSGFVVENVNWMGIAPPRKPLTCEVQVRYRSRPVPAAVTNAGHSRVHVTLDGPRPAVTPGQAAVFYDGELLLGGGWITREE